jgi:predicted peptidase
MTSRSLVTLLACAALVVSFATTCGSTSAHSRVRVIPLVSEGTALKERVETITKTVAVEAYESGAFRGSNGVVLPYRLLRPQRASPGVPAPLVVIFHGSGAIGTDNRAQIGPVAKSWATRAMRERFPAFVLVPQFPVRSAEYVLSEGKRVRATPTPALEAAWELVEQMQRELKVDRAKTFATGFSMGGSAIWNTLALKPGMFSAVAIVAGVPNPDAFSRLGTTRVLLVHGEEDKDNPFDAAWSAYGAVEAHAEFWRFAGVAHDFPQRLIADAELAEWLFSGRR